MEREFPNRKTPRLKNFDYSSPNYYFITICTHSKRCLFGTVEENNPWRKIAEEGIHQIPLHFPSVTVDLFTVMPNHIHAIIVIKEGNHSLSSIVGSFKAFVSREIHRTDPHMIIWQRSFHDHIILSQKSYEKIWGYIENNHRKWREDCFFSEDV